MARPSGTGSPAASEAVSASPVTRRWSGREVVALAVVILVGVVIRAVLMPVDAFRPDLDQFVLWVHGIATGGLGHAYDQDLSFGPVIALIWSVLAAIEPAFRTATDASDPTIRVLMKIPPVLADIGLALLVAYALRERPRWAIAGAAVIMLHPAVIDISAWWGQYESVYLLSALAAVVFAVNGRNGLAAAALALAIMTKPQALPFILPFAAWFWARGGLRGLVTAAAIGLGVIVVIWLPFVGAGGPANYLDHVTQFQNGIFALLSLRAWNLWWLVQAGLAGGQFVMDQGAIAGPITGRQVGYALTFLFALLIAIRVLRDPRPRTLVLALAATTLVAFCFLTGMHERYAYGAVVFFALLIPERPVRWLALGFGVVFTLNLLAAVPPTPAIGDLLPVDGLFGVVGSLAMLALTGATIALLMRRDDPAVQDHRVAAAAASGGL
jgi:hypothetical protein